MPVQGAWDGPGEKNPPPGPEREEQQWPTAESQTPTFKLPEALQHGVLKSGPVCCSIMGPNKSQRTMEAVSPQFLWLFWMSSLLANGHTV